MTRRGGVMAYVPASRPLPAAGHAPAEERDSAVVPKLVALFLGIAVGVLIPVMIWLAASAQSASSDASAAAAPAMAMPGTAKPATLAGGATATPSFAGVAPANADALAAAHRAVPAALPRLQPGPVARVSLSINHRTIS